MRRSTTSNDGWFWTNLRIYTPFRALAVGIAAATLTVGCGREAGMARELESLPFGAGREVSSELTLEDKLERDADQLRVQLSSDEQLDRARVERMAKRVSKSVAVLEAKLVSSEGKLATLENEAALARVSEAREAVSAARTAFDRSVVTFGSSQSDAGVALLKALNELVPAEAQQPLSAGMAFRDTDPVRASVPLSSSSTPAYAAPTSGSPASSLPRTPGADDLAATPETKVTPPIQELANDLDRDPVKIFNYVRNTIKFEPYLGIRKGAGGTLSEKSGSDSDQAALLIALLRASGTHARFVQGTVELAPAQVRAWLGLNGTEATDGQLADILASGGLPTSQVKANGQVAKIRTGHVWAEAYVANDAYRGVDEGLGNKGWVALDPSVKSLRDKEEVVDVGFSPSEVEDLGQSLIDGVNEEPDADSFTFDLSAAQPKLNAIAQTATTGGAPANVESALDIDGVEIEQRNLPVLPSSLPFRTIAVTGEVRGLPEQLFSRVVVEVKGATPSGRIPTVGDDAEGGLSTVVRTMDAAYGRFTIAYSPASQEDAELVDAYHGLFDTPANAARVVPVARLNGEVVASGAAPVGMGYTQRLRLKYISPGFAPDVVDNPLGAGGLTALSIDVGTKTLAQVESRWNRLDALPTATAANTGTDARLGEMLAAAGDLYFLKNDVFNASAVGKRKNVHVQRAVSGALVQLGLRTTVVAGFPLSVGVSGVAVDVDQDVQAVNAFGEDRDLHEKLYMEASASTASASESDCLDVQFQTRGAVSTSRALAAAVKQGIPIFHITSANAASVMPQLQISPAVASQITEAVAGGASVTVPKRTMSMDGWTGDVYILEKDGARDYRITGGSSGAILNILKFFVPGVGEAKDASELLDLLSVMINNGVADGGKCFVVILLQIIGMAAGVLYDILYGIAIAALFAIIIGAGVATGGLAAILFVLLILVVLDQLLDAVKNDAAEECTGGP